MLENTLWSGLDACGFSIFRILRPGGHITGASRCTRCFFSSSRSAPLGSEEKISSNCSLGGVGSAPEPPREGAELQALACRRGWSRGGSTPSGQGLRPMPDEVWSSDLGSRLLGSLPPWACRRFQKGAIYVPRLFAGKHTRGFFVLLC